MSEEIISLGEREDKLAVRIIIIIFGLVCIFTAGWWIVFLIKNPDNEKIFWAGSIFLFLFGAFQVYSGLGYARRYVKREDGILTLRQNSLLPAKKISPDQVKHLEIRTYDMLIHLVDGPGIRIKLGLRYPDLGQKVRDFITGYAKDNNIEIFYKNEAL